MSSGGASSGVWAAVKAMYRNNGSSEYFLAWSAIRSVAISAKRSGHFKVGFYKSKKIRENQFHGIFFDIFWMYCKWLILLWFVQRCSSTFWEHVDGIFWSYSPSPFSENCLLLPPLLLNRFCLLPVFARLQSFAIFFFKNDILKRYFCHFLDTILFLKVNFRSDAEARACHQANWLRSYREPNIQSDRELHLSSYQASNI